MGANPSLPAKLTLSLKFEYIQMLAFQPQSVVTDLPFRIESICVDSEQLLIGGANGTLLVFKVPSTSHDTTSSSFLQPVLVETRKQFTRKSIDQMCIVRELDLLCVLSDATIHLYDSKTLLLKSQLGRTRGATAFAMHRCIEITKPSIPIAVDSSDSTSDHSRQRSLSSVSDTASSIAGTTPPSSISQNTNLLQRNPSFIRSLEPGMPQMVTKLAVVSKRRVFIFKWIDSDYVDTQEIKISASASRTKSIAWLADDQLCVGLIKDYLMVDTVTGMCREMFSTDGAIASARPTNTESANFTPPSPLKISKALVTRLPVGDEVLVSRESTSIFVGRNGLPARDYGITWSSPPEQIAYSYPFLIATIMGDQSDAGCVEVRNIATQKLVQKLDLPLARLATNTANGRGNVYISNDKQVWKLSSLSFERQVDHLLKLNQFVEALSLLEQIDSLPSAEKSVKIKSISLQQAVHWFYNSEYEKSLAKLSELAADPTDVVSTLYPSLVSDNLRKVFQLPVRDLESSVKKKLGAIFNQSTTLQTTPTLASTLLQAGKQSPISAGDVDSTIRSLIYYLTETRSRLLRQRRASPPSHLSEKSRAEVSFMTLTTDSSSSYSAPVASQATFISSVDDGAVSKVTPENSSSMTLSFVDTMLLKCYLQTTESLVGPLLRLPNYCNVDEAERMLVKKKKDAELMDLFFGKGLHRRALTILMKRWKMSNHASQDSRTIISYLQRLDSSDLDIILEYSAVLLQADVGAGMQVFIEDTPLHVSLPRAKIIDHLEQVSSQAVIAYLEHIILRLHDETPDFHDRLALWYLEQASVTNDTKSEEPYPPLLNFLQKSVFYHPDKMLSRFPVNSLYRERAVLLSRMKQHEQVLSIYVNKLHDCTSAEEYCKTAVIGTPTIYHSLFKLYLEQDDGSSNPAIKLLSDFGDRIHPSQALPLLPSSMAIQYLSLYFFKYINFQNSCKSQLSITKNILKAHRSQLSTKLVILKQRRFVVDDFTMCCVCMKRLGSYSAIVALDLSDHSRKLIHYGCRA